MNWYAIASKLQKVLKIISEDKMVMDKDRQNKWNLGQGKLAN